MDKRVSRELLEMCRTRVSTHIDQWQLIGILAVGMKNSPSKTWESSFIAVNLHLDHRVSFKKWLEKIQPHIKIGESTYLRTRQSMFDAMPGFWKNLKTEGRQRIVQRIRTLAEEEGTVHKVFTNKNHLLSFAKYVPYNEVTKLPIIYQVTLEHPEVIVGGPDPVNLSSSEPNEATTPKKPPPLQSFMLLPQNFVSAATDAKCEKSKKEGRENLFKHIVQFRNRVHHKEKEVTVSSYLNVDVSEDQQALLNPTVLDSITGWIIKDSQGEGARKKMAKRRINLLDGKINSHCCVLNSDERQNLIQQANEVAAVMADLENERQKEK